MKIRFMVIGYGMIAALPACHSRNRQVETAPQAPAQAFTMPAIPAAITAPGERANYLVTHYWDKFNFADTAYIHQPEVAEQALADYLSVMPYASVEETKRSVGQVLVRAEQEKSGQMYGFFLEMFDKYLYDPNSPYRDDEFYIPVATHVIADKRSGEAEKIRMKHTLEGLLKNRQGTVATDFAYLLADGKRGSLHALRADYTLLMFYNPDCHTCSEAVASLRHSSLVNRLHTTGTLAILLFYPDEDIEIWKAHLSEIPAGWINGYDPQAKVKEEEIYDLRAIPTLYLLDRDKKVLLKDANFEKVQTWLIDRFR
ncbi:MAG: DUF5106 domain-containing protein [Tannerella sp.]|jgi:hypothetical protein|nr:DUF5106 domain-containing protein [Tannerella sp.]